MTSLSSDPLLTVRDLVTVFRTPTGIVTAVDQVSFQVAPGEIVGIVGESGSGKSVTSRSVMRMVHEPGSIESGSVTLRGRDLLTLSEKEMRKVRGSEIAMIFQDPQAALNPVIKIGEQIEETLRIHGARREEARSRSLELLAQVGIPEPERAAERYQHEFSGGMRQRVVIAIALANRPSLLIADEPTTALDVTIQAQILALLRKLRDELGIAIIFITHDMGVVSEICDRVEVMYKGKIVEEGPVAQILSRPAHPYTISLMKAVPSIDAPLREPYVGAASDTGADTPALELTDVRTDVLAGRRGLILKKNPFYAVDGVSLQVHHGETLALVGESGCGKSTLSRTIVGINPVASGRILINGQDVTEPTAANRKATIHGVQYVFQDPYSSLNPRRTAGQSLQEALRVAGVPPRQITDRAVALLEQVGLGAQYLDRYPYAFSGGQRQRIGIARALAGQADVLILDEPVSALDVSIQAEILALLTQIQHDTNLGYLFISHDLTVVREISHRVAVMNRGKIVESGTTEQIFDHPQEQYTRTLLASTPKLVSAV
jgi:ABC-type glutathione transport system ATPase component